MICITVSREELQKISTGKEGKIQTKTIPSDTSNIKDLLKIFDVIAKRRYLGRKEKNDRNRIHESARCYPARCTLRTLFLGQSA